MTADTTKIERAKELVRLLRMPGDAALNDEQCRKTARILEDLTADLEEARAKLARFESAALPGTVAEIEKQFATNQPKIDAGRWYGGATWTDVLSWCAALLDAYRAQSLALGDANRDYMRAMGERDTARQALEIANANCEKLGKNASAERERLKRELAEEHVQLVATQMELRDEQRAHQRAAVDRDDARHDLAKMTSGTELWIKSPTTQLATAKEQLSRAERDKEAMRGRIEGLRSYKRVAGLMSPAEKGDWVLRDDVLYLFAKPLDGGAEKAEPTLELDTSGDILKVKTSKPAWPIELERLKNDRSAKNLCLLTSARLEKLEPLEALRRVVLEILTVLAHRAAKPETEGA